MHIIVGNFKFCIIVLPNCTMLYYVFSGPLSLRAYLPEIKFNNNNIIIIAILFLSISEEWIMLALPFQLLGSYIFIHNPNYNLGNSHEHAHRKKPIIISSGVV